MQEYSGQQLHKMHFIKRRQSHPSAGPLPTEVQHSRPVNLLSFKKR